MKIVTTPMCQGILRRAGVREFQISNNGDYGDADVAIVLSETEAHNNSHIKFIKLKLNTFSQIEDSIRMVSRITGTEPLIEQIGYKEQMEYNLGNSPQSMSENREIKVKVYSKFLREIVEDMGFRVVTGNIYDFLVYPDYLKDQIKKEIDSADERAIELPSHGNAPLNPLKRAEIRYQILEKSICMKH